MPPAPDPADRLAQVRARFYARLAQDRALLEQDGLPEADIVTLVHRIAGLAGTLGMAQLSEEAKLCEKALVGQAGAARAGSPAIARFVQVIDAQIAAGAQGARPAE